MTFRLNRRQFLSQTTLAGAGLLAAGSVSPLRAVTAPPEPINLAIMGLGRGASLAADFAKIPGTRITHLCDVDDLRLNQAQAVFAKKLPTPPIAVKDVRRILDDPSVHALVIAAPDHWHGPATILACAAGKHVYVEKPVSHNAREGELMVAAARKYNRVVQVGTQRRSWPGILEGIQRLREGAIGTVRFSRGWYNNTRGSIGRGKPAPIPKTLDWTLFQGPAPEKPYQDNIIHYNWHWFWHWGTGELGNNGIHALDLCRWGLGVDYPRRITSAGGRYHFSDDQQTPDTQIVTFDFGDKAIVWEGRSCHPHGFEGSSFGAAFHGDQGTLILDSSGYTLLDPKDKPIEKKPGPSSDIPHLQNFLSCIRDNQRPNADIEQGHQSTLLCHLGNIAHRVSRVLTLDSQSHTILNDPEAQSLWSRTYRPTWEPKV